MTIGATRSTVVDDGSDGADSGCATDLNKTLGSDSGGLMGSRSDDLRMGGRKGKADSHSLLYWGTLQEYLKGCGSTLRT